MAINNEKYIDVDLAKGTLIRTFALNLFGEGDNNGDRIGVRVFNNGSPVSLSAMECIGYFIRPDGITLLMEATISGNEAYFDLPQAAYAKIGNIKLTFKLLNGNTTNSILVVDGTVIETTTGYVYDPSAIIGSLDDFIAYIERAEAAVAAVDALTVQATQIEGTRYKIEVTKEE